MPAGQGPPVVLVPVDRSDDSWLFVKNMLRSCPSAQLVGLQRVHWPLLWDEFVGFRDRYLGESANEQFLFHGTGPCSTTELFAHPCGLDPRFSPGGFYGKGIYLAEEASYPIGDKSAHPIPGSGGKRLQLLLVRANLGTQQELGQWIDSTTRAMQMPDVRPAEHERFHSVRAGPHRPRIADSSLDASVIHVVYEYRQLYPQYVLEIEVDLAPAVASAATRALPSNRGSSGSSSGRGREADRGSSSRIRPAPASPPSKREWVASSREQKPSAQPRQFGVPARLVLQPPAAAASRFAPTPRPASSGASAANSAAAAVPSALAAAARINSSCSSASPALAGESAKRVRRFWSPDATEAPALNPLGAPPPSLPFQLRSTAFPMPAPAAVPFAPASEVVSLVAALVREGPPADKTVPAAALRHLLFKGEGGESAKFCVAAMGGVEALVALLCAGTPEGKAAAAGALCNLSEDEGRKETIVAMGGIGALVALVRDGSPDGKAAGAWALNILASKHLGRSASIVAAGGLGVLAALARDGTPPGKTAAAWALRVLGQPFA